jgi:TAT (twin-arginine translocation) pathway signal sequence
MTRRSISRRQILRTSAALSAAGTTAWVRGVPPAGAAVKLTAVSAMVAEAEVAWEKEVQQKWNRANPDAPWERENVGWETIFEKVLAYEKAGSPLSCGRSARTSGRSTPSSRSPRSGCRVPSPSRTTAGRSASPPS